MLHSSRGIGIMKILKLETYQNGKIQKAKKL